MALEDITSRIAAKADQEAARILNEARLECEDMRRKAQTRIEGRTTAALEKAEQEAASVEARLVAAAELEAKMRKLAARQAVISSVLDTAIAELAEADEDTYVVFLQTMLEKTPFSGETELIVSKKDHGLLKRTLSRLQTAMVRAGKDVELRLSDTPRELGGGFVLRQGRVEYNASFESIRRSREEELRSLASSVLFPKEVAS